MNALLDSRIRFIATRHEQGAAFMADVYGRLSGKVGYGRTSSVEFGNPDLVRFAESFRAAGYRVTEPSELPALFAQARASAVPVVIDCPVDYGEKIRLTERLQALPFGG